MAEHESTEGDHRCSTPPTALPGDEWTCPTCGVTYFASDDDGPDCTFEWVVAPREARTPRGAGAAVVGITPSDKFVPPTLHLDCPPG